MRLLQDESFFEDFLGAQAGFGGESREMRLAVGRQANFHNQPHIALDIRTSTHPPCPRFRNRFPYRRLGEASTASGEVMSANDTFSDVITSMTVGTREAIAS
jgi:hypothetical protein